MARRQAFTIWLALAICGSPTLADEMPYNGSREALLSFFGNHRLSDWVLPEWSDQLVVDYFEPKPGVKLRYSQWPRATSAHGRGTVVFFSGRTEFIERNVLTYHALAEKGWDVWTLDWRGQGLSFRALTGEAADRGHIDDFGTYLDDAAKFIDNVVRLQDRDGPHVLLAHSMGGQIAIRYVIEHPLTFDRVVLSSPLISLPDDWLVTADSIVKDVLSNVRAVTEGCVPGRPSAWQSSFIGSACEALDDPGNAALRNEDSTSRFTHDKRNLAPSFLELRSKLLDCLRDR